MYQYSGSSTGSVRSVCFGLRGSASGSVSQRYESEDPDPYPDQYPKCHTDFVQIPQGEEASSQRVSVRGGGGQVPGAVLL
jgi:hypothetical protein